MKKIVYFAIFLGFIQSINAQNISDSEIKSKGYRFLDKVIYRFTYKQTSVPDVLLPQKVQENTMCLQVGNRVSKYFDQKVFLADSLREVQIKQRMLADESSKILVPLLRGSISENIFKNYPEGKITVTNRIPFSTYKYEEVFEYPVWTLENGHNTVCGYACKRATTTFRGRKYEAWYAEEIPISDGPWKFGGLPGLILKIEDEQQHYIFECIGIEKPVGEESLYFNLSYNYINTSKKEFSKGLAEYNKNPGAHVANTGLIKSEIPARAYKSRPYNPIELGE